MKRTNFRRMARKSLFCVLTALIVLTGLLGLFSVPAGAVTVGQFSDVSPNAWYASSVQWAVENDITAGTSDYTFSPSDPCTRAQVAAFLYRAAGEPDTGDDNPFVDVSSDAWYYEPVLWAAENGITAGTSENTFSPDAPCTRAQVVTFLYRFSNGHTSSLNNPFVDVYPDTWYFEPVVWAVENGITSGTSANTFSPDSTCTRAEIVTFIRNDIAGAWTYYPPSPTPVPPVAPDDSSDTGVSYDEFYNLEDLEDFLWNPHPQNTPKPAVKPATKPTDNPTAKSAPTSKPTSAPAVTESPAPTKTPSEVPASTPKTEATSKPASVGKYDYEVYLLRADNYKMYRDDNIALYVKTDNPDSSSFDFLCDLPDGVTYVTQYGTVPTGELPILDDHIVEFGKERLDGVEGYACALYFSSDYFKFMGESETYTVKLVEHDMSDRENYGYLLDEHNVTVKTFPVTLYDYDAEQNEAFDKLLAVAGVNDSMNPLEKMTAAVNYLDELRDNGTIKYFPVSHGREVTGMARTPNNPWFESMRMDSATSPAMLADLANYIGGFEDVHSCFNEVPRTDPLWTNIHYLCAVTYQGEEYTFECCPSPGEDIGDVQMLDLNNTSQFKRLV